MATRLSSFSNQYKKSIILVILSAQMVTGIFAFSMDLFYPFSSAKAAAQLIESKHITDQPIIANYTASPLSAFLNKEIYFLETEQYGSFMKWDKKWVDTRWNKKIHLKNIHKYFNENNNNNILLILDYGSSRNFVETQTEPRNILGYLKASGLENRLFFSELFGVYLPRK